MGFQTKTITEYTIVKEKVDLGKIILVADSQVLDEVVVTGELSKTVFKLDKRVFSVGKDISSTAVSALEVLNNVPSVNVGIEGDISLRGSKSLKKSLIKFLKLNILTENYGVLLFFLNRQTVKIIMLF